MKTRRFVQIAGLVLSTSLTAQVYADYVGSMVGNQAVIKEGLDQSNNKPVKEAGYRNTNPSLDRL